MKKIVCGVAGAVAAFTLVGCYENGKSSCDGTSPPRPLTVEDIRAEFITDWDGDYSWASASSLDLSQPYSPSELNIRLEAEDSNRYSSQSNERSWSLSFIRKANACSYASPGYEQYLDSIRVFVNSASNENVAEGIELTDQMLVVADVLYETGEMPLEQWNELDIERVYDRNIRGPMAAITFNEGAELLPGSYEFQLMVELDNGDLYEIDMPAITIE